MDPCSSNPYCSRVSCKYSGRNSALRMDVCPARVLRMSELNTETRWGFSLDPFPGSFPCTDSESLLSPGIPAAPPTLAQLAQAVVQSSGGDRGVVTRNSAGEGAVRPGPLCSGSPRLMAIGEPTRSGRDTCFDRRGSLRCAGSWV